MELSGYCLNKPNHILSPLYTPKPKFSPIPSQKLQTQQLNSSIWKKPSRSMAVIGCAKLEKIKEVEKENDEWAGIGEIWKEKLEKIKEVEKEDDEWAGIGEIWKEKCRREGIEEVMECLEREAIMGEDYGREPNDYNRRAYIFDKSNKVFQALKEKESNPEMLIS